MNIYVDLTDHQFSNSRGVPVTRPFEFVAGSIPQLRIQFLRNGAVIAPNLRSMSVSLGRLGAATAASSSIYSVESPNNTHLVQLDLSTATVTEALSYASWATATSDGSKRSYLFGDPEDLTSLVTAKGFRVIVTPSGGTAYAVPNGLFSVDALARVVTFDRSAIPTNNAAIKVEATIPRGKFYLRVTAADIFSDTTSSTTNTSNTVTVPSTLGIFAGATVSGTGIPNGATVAAVISSTSFTLSSSATATGTPTLTIQRSRTTSVTGPAYVSAVIA